MAWGYISFSAQVSYHTYSKFTLALAAFLRGRFGALTRNLVEGHKFDGTHIKCTLGWDVMVFFNVFFNKSINQCSLLQKSDH